MIRPLDSRGVTVVELLVVLAILGLMAGVVGLAWRPSLRHGDESPLIVARQRAIRSGVAMRFQMAGESDTVMLFALPDGSVIGTGALPIDPLTGAPAPDEAP